MEKRIVSTMRLSVPQTHVSESQEILNMQDLDQQYV